MALTRPNAVVYQEYETIVPATDTPDLDALIAGPCYQILDYLDDKTDCAEDTDYGTLDSTVPAAGKTYTDPVAVTFATPKNLETGALLNADSVKLFFDTVKVEVIGSGDTPHDPNFRGAYTTGDNKFSGSVADAGVNFKVAGVVAGDILYAQSEAVPTTIYKKTVKELAHTFHDDSGTLDFLTNGVAAGDTITITADAVPSPNSRNGVYTVKRVLGEADLEVTEVIPGVGVWLGVPTADVAVTSPIGTVKTSGNVILWSWCHLRCTTDFAETTAGTTVRWRIERSLNNVEMDSTDFSVTNNSITVDASLTTAVTGLTGNKPITYSKIYFEYTALRTDLAREIETTSPTERLDLLGKIDARNPLAVGAYVASLNAPTMPIKIYGLDSTNEVTAYQVMLERLATSRALYTITPLTYNKTVLAMLNSSMENLADPTYNLTHGTKQKFRATLGAVELVTTKYMQAIAGGASTLQENGTDVPAVVRTGTLSGLVGGTATLITSDILPGDIVDIDGTPTYIVSHVNTDLQFEVDAAGGPVVLYTSLAGDVVKFYAPGGIATPKLVLTDVGGAEIVITPGNNDKLFTILSLPNATFLTDSVIPGDTIEIPTDPMVDSWTTYSSWVVEEVLSEERLRIRNNGSNTSTVQNEFPHTGKRTGGASIIQGSIYVRVSRVLTKEQQVTELVSVATSFASKRIKLCYPSLVDVTNLVDGSKTRTGTGPEAADSQPGYYLACVVAGLTAAKPSQQGFTNLGIAGIDRVYNSSEYFTEEQLTELSNNGIDVFVQETPSALPKSIHSVTTDVSGITFGEYMCVKNVDFVSWTFLDTILGYIGTWNVTDQALDFLRLSLQNDINNLKARFVSKFGAPLKSATITGVEFSELSADRIEAYIDGDFPVPLNTVGLHLVV